MDIDRPIHDRGSASDCARRVLVAVHGREPTEWELEVARALTRTPGATVRVLAVTDVPSPPWAALLPAAQRAVARARIEWQRREKAMVARRLDALLGRLPVVPEVAWVHVSDADPGRAIVERAAVWAADLIVVGTDRTSWLHQRLLGAIHERVVAQAACAVLVVAAPGQGSAQASAGPSAASGSAQWTATAQGGA
jgi:nucleotide-binding universal stress UspA family protein